MAGLSFSSASALSCRVRWCLALALLACRIACGASELCEGIVQLTGMSGRMQMVGGSLLGGRRVCQWRIDPGVQVRVIAFKVHVGVFGGDDCLLLQDGEHNSLAVYADEMPLDKEFFLVGPSVAQWTLLSSSNQTRVDMEYAVKALSETHVPNDEIALPQLAVLICVAALVIFFLCFVAPLIGVFHVRSRREHERIIRESHVIRHSEHARIRTRGHDMSEEHWIQGQLEALPQETYQHGARDLEECCLCLENFNPDDPLRVLPCQHYFHKKCIDTWFSTGRFRARRCPLCNANPVTGQRPVHIDAHVTPALRTRPTSREATAIVTSSRAAGQVPVQGTTSSLSPSTFGRRANVDDASAQVEPSPGPQSLDGASLSGRAEASSIHDIVEM